MPPQVKDAILIMGTPNIGKSAIFNNFTGMDVSVANYVGTTVDFTIGSADLKGTKFWLVDVPGTYTLDATNVAEKVATEMLAGESAYKGEALAKKPVVVICVLDANDLETGMYLLLQILEQGLPVVVAINRIDLLRQKGQDVNTALLASELGVPVTATVAVTGEGLEDLQDQILQAAQAGQKSVTNWSTKPDFRWIKAEELVLQVIKKPVIAVDSGYRKKIGEMLVAPWPGLPLAVLILVFAFTIVIGVGMGLRQTILLPLVREMIIPQIEWVVQSMIPAGIIQNILIGEFGFLVKGLEWPLTLVLPYVISFYIALSILEDSGYLPRLGCLLDGLLHRIGLHGSSVVPLMLGYGCGIPAILSTRALNSIKERWIVTIMVCVSVPCIAQTGALISLLAERSIPVMLAVFALSILAMIISGLVTNRLLTGQVPPVLMEIPELLLPSAKVILKKVWIRIKRFLVDGVLPLMAVIAVAALLYETGAMTVFGKFLSPLVTGWLHLPEEAAVPLVLGILRRELAVLPLIEMDLTTLQLFVGAVVALFYVPCIAMVAIVAREFSVWAAVKVLVLTTALAFLLGGIFAHLGAWIF